MEQPVLPAMDVDACQRLVCALELRGDRAETVGAWCALGAALASQDRFEEALIAYKEAVARKPDCLRALVRLGRLHVELGAPTKAIAYFQQAIAVKPCHRWAHFGLGWALLLLGDFEHGWDELAWEPRSVPDEQLDVEQPCWDGSSLHGRTILLWSDWGMGDAIQFLRYALLLKARGARVLVRCDGGLAPLVERVTGVDAVVPHGMPLPAFDVHASLVSLPRLFRTRADTIPSNLPYVELDDEPREMWRRRLKKEPDPACAQTMNVGLAWAGRPDAKDARYRFLALAALAPLGEVPGVRFVSLQQSPSREEADAATSGPRLDMFQPECASIMETAALVRNLDLIVTVDTMIAHLAGALGRPVWTLLAAAPDWRWQLTGESSPWYPTMRLFRQTRRGEWSDVIARVRTALEVEVRRWRQSAADGVARAARSQ